MVVNTFKKADLSRHVAVLRVVFGLMWVVDALFKWQSAFRADFLGDIQTAAQGQPTWLNWWFNFWLKLLGNGPHTFAVLIAVVESLIALALIFGFARRVTYLSAAVFSLLIWSVAEGFGGPYNSGSTDIGTGIIYAVVFFSLYGLDRMAIPPSFSIDTYIEKSIPWWAVVANP